MNKNKNKIIIESGAFPSDQYAIDSQVKLHGLDPKNVVVELNPRNGEDSLRTEDIIQTIDSCREELSMVLMGGVNYYTGQAFDLKTITESAHSVGAIAGFDLAHAAGNIYWIYIIGMLILLPGVVINIYVLAQALHREYLFMRSIMNGMDLDSKDGGAMINQHALK